MSTINTELLGREWSMPFAGTWLAFWLVVLRVTVGWWMLHAGMDKLWDWPFDAGWFVGGRAADTTVGPVVTVFDSGILLDVVNVAIPFGQVAIGLGVILGCLTRTAAFFGAFLMLFFFFINGETGGWSHGIVTGELLGLVVFAMIATLGAGRILGIDAYLVETDFVNNHPKTRFFMG